MRRTEIDRKRAAREPQDVIDDRGLPGDARGSWTSSDHPTVALTGDIEWEQRSAPRPSLATRARTFDDKVAPRGEHRRTLAREPPSDRDVAHLLAARGAPLRIT